MSDQHKAIIELACGDTMREAIAQGEAQQWKAIKEIQAQGVQIKKWPPEIIAAYEKAWNEVVAEETGKNAKFQEGLGRLHAVPQGLCDLA